MHVRIKCMQGMRHVHRMRMRYIGPMNLLTVPCFNVRAAAAPAVHASRHAAIRQNTVEAFVILGAIVTRLLGDELSIAVIGCCCTAVQVLPVCTAVFVSELAVDVWWIQTVGLYRLDLTMQAAADHAGRSEGRLCFRSLIEGRPMKPGRPARWPAPKAAVTCTHSRLNRLYKASSGDQHHQLAIG